jgi:hypothetical protein
MTMVRQVSTTMTAAMDTAAITIIFMAMIMIMIMIMTTTIIMTRKQSGGRYSL